MRTLQSRRLVKRSEALARSLILASVLAWSCRPEIGRAMSEIQDHFKSIRIDEAPPEIAQALKERVHDEPRLKLAGGKDDTIGLGLTVVRIEDENCDGKFCPTYFKYSLDRGSPSTQTLMLKCEEWLWVGDNWQPIRSGAEVVWITAWVVVKTDAGEAQVTFTRLGPTISFKK
jgi:hypothetical protein